MWKFALVITAALLGKAAFGFDIPNWVQPSGQQSSVAGNYEIAGPAPLQSCANKAAASQYLRDWRERARAGYAKMVGKNIPSLTPGAKCIKHSDAVDVKYEAAGNFFTVTCLAESRGRLTHLFKMELLVEPATCLSDAEINKFVNSAQCQQKADIDRYISLQLSPCPIGKVPPQIRSGNTVYPIDVAYFTYLLNQSPQIGNIVDQDRKVKVGSSTSGGSDNPEDCNAGGCWPGGRTAK